MGYVRIEFKPYLGHQGSYVYTTEDWDYQLSMVEADGGAWVDYPLNEEVGMLTSLANLVQFSYTRTLITEAEYLAGKQAGPQGDFHDIGQLLDYRTHHTPLEMEKKQ